MLLVRTPTVALLGNPNTGKTTLFNALAGMNQHVGNYPGVTVETKKGKFRCHDQVYELIDLPGTYSLAPRSPDEMVAVDLILGQKNGDPRPDLVVAIVDASNLERNLYLMTQALELGVPVVIALNMVDVARRQGISIDAGQLACKLGVPVVPIQANKRLGLDELKQTIARTLALQPHTCGPQFPDAFEREVASLREHLGDGVPTYLVRRLLLDVGGYTEQLLQERHGNGLIRQAQEARQRLGKIGCGVPAVEARIRYGWIRQALAGCVQRPAQRIITWTDRLDRVLTHQIWGTLVFLLLMFVVFQSIFTWARPLMELINGGFELLGSRVADLLTPGPLRSLIVDGVIGGVGAVLVFLPQIFILFAFIAVLEDCGYMARAAYLMDRLMARAGLNGKSFIPMLSSVACAVPGIMAARVIENRRDRFATMMVAPLMSCSARLPVYILLIAAFIPSVTLLSIPLWTVEDGQTLSLVLLDLQGLTLFSMYMIGLVMAPLVALLLKRTLLRGETPVFVMEMPLYKLPSLKLILRRSMDSGWMFVRRAGTLILASMIVVWALLYFPTSDGQGHSFPQAIAQMEDELDSLREQKSPGADERIEELEKAMKHKDSEWKGQSWLGRMGKAIAPIVRPLGWDWRIGMAALASFPAREVFVGSMGIIYGQGKVDVGEEAERQSFSEVLRGVHWDDDPSRLVFSVPVALSIMVFFALCCQCVSTLAIIKRETSSWRWPTFTFVYMTLLAYLGALIVYQVANRLFV